MCDVLHFAKLTSIILHGRKMMDSAPAQILRLFNTSSGKEPPLPSPLF